MRGVPADKSAAMMAPKQKVEKPMRIMGRLFGYILRRYKLHCLGVLLFIFGSTAATVAGNLFMKTLIDDYIVPYIGEGGASDFGPLLAALLGGAFVGVGVGMVVRQGGSSGGDDALALVISRKTGWRLSRAYLFTDLTVLGLSLTYIAPLRIVWSLITVTVSSLLIDLIKSAGHSENRPKA